MMIVVKDITGDHDQGGGDIGNNNVNQTVEVTDDENDNKNKKKKN